jgi:hypothetical protein
MMTMFGVFLFFKIVDQVKEWQDFAIKKNKSVNI